MNSMLLLMVFMMWRWRLDFQERHESGVRISRCGHVEAADLPIGVEDELQTARLLRSEAILSFHFLRCKVHSLLLSGECGDWYHDKHDVSEQMSSASRPTSTSTPDIEYVPKPNCYRLGPHDYKHQPPCTARASHLFWR